LSVRVIANVGTLCSHPHLKSPSNVAEVNGGVAGKTNHITVVVKVCGLSCDDFKQCEVNSAELNLKAVSVYRYFRWLIKAGLALSVLLLDCFRLSGLSGCTDGYKALCCRKTVVAI